MASQTVTGPELQYTDDNKHAYAYSGVVLSTGSAAPDDNLLNFATTSNYIIADITFQNDITSGSDVYFEIKFNDNIVILNKEASSSITEPWSWKILIPPETTVNIAWGTQGGATNFKGTVAVMGRVYEYLPVRN